MNTDRMLLELHDVTRTFNVRRGLWAEPGLLTAVDAVNLTIHAGEPLGLVGESGCGKSTLGRMVAGLLAPTSGRVQLHPAGAVCRATSTSRAPSDTTTPPTACGPSRSSAAGRVQMIFQDPFSSLNPRMTIGASIAEPLAIQGVAAQTRRDAVNAMLELVGLSTAQAGRYPHEFSGGQRQRIAVARALITHPALIVCDEPVSALDASVQAQVLNLLREVQERFSPAYLFISHDLAVVGFMCQRIAVMYLGKIMEEGTREQILGNSAHPYTQALLAAMPRHDPAQRNHGHILRGELPSPLHPPAGCPFHPRCAQALPHCADTPPPRTTLDTAHKVRCHLYS